MSPKKFFGSRCSGILTRWAFNYTAPTTWNSIPADILTCDSESGFKRLLKTRLFNNSFNVAWLTHSQRLCSSAYGALQICFMIMIMIASGFVANDCRNAAANHCRQRRSRCSRSGVDSFLIQVCLPWTVRNVVFCQHLYYNAYTHAYLYVAVSLTV